MKRLLEQLPWLPLLLFAVFASGCRSPYVAVKIQNSSPAPIQLIEVDYPSASFGVDALAAGAVYPYHFKVQGSGPVAVSFTDAAGHPHQSSGPALHSGQMGSLTIEIGPADEVIWQAHLIAQK